MDEPLVLDFRSEEVKKRELVVGRLQNMEKR